MDTLKSCLGMRKRTDEREPLLPQYENDTVMQRELHQKLHTYQQFRALGKGFMPNTEQLIINLRTLLACLLYTSPSPRDGLLSRMPSSA